MSWQIDTITLPYLPPTISDRTIADSQSVRQPGQLPFIISFGVKERKLTIEGWILETGKTKTQLETDYIIPLRNKVHSKVTIAALDTRYDGDWILDEFEAKEAPGYATAFQFKMVFSKGSDYVVF